MEEGALEPQTARGLPDKSSRPMKDGRRNLTMEQMLLQSKATDTGSQNGVRRIVMGGERLRIAHKLPINAAKLDSTNEGKLRWIVHRSSGRCF